jgi:hypothetical protein
MTPEQLAKMQAGRAAAAAAKKAEADRLAADEDAQWRELHERALADHRKSWEGRK